MKPELAPELLKKTRPWEHALRFVFGGAICVATGLVAKAWGPAVGGLFLAFPAILPASLTLGKQHDGRARAVDDARGGRLGSAGLGAFALVVAAFVGHVPFTIVLVLASTAWLALDVSLWFAKYATEA